MQRTDSKQYANIKQYVLVVLHTIKYWFSSNNKEFTFDSTSDWSLAVTALTSVNTSTNSGVKVYAGVSKSPVGITSIQTYNPLVTLTRVTTKPFQFTATNQVAGKLVNADYTNNTIWGASFENIGASNNINIRYYTNAGLTAYYNVAIALPTAVTRYKANYNPFVVGTYGIVGTAITSGGLLYNTASAVVTIVGGATGTTIVGISESTTGVITGGVIPIYLEGVNNSTQLVGQKTSLVLCCLKEFVEELQRDYDELECSGNVAGKSLKSQKLNLNFTVQKNIELLVALGMGNDIIEKILSITGKKSELTIVSGTNITATLSGNVTPTNLAFVTLDNGSECVTLQRDYINNTTATLDNNFYFVDVTNNQLILPQSMSQNTVINGYPITSQLVRAIDYYTEGNPIQCVLEVQKQSVDGTQITGGLFTIELGVGSAKADDKGDTMEFKNTAVLTGKGQSVKFVY